MALSRDQITGMYSPYTQGEGESLLDYYARLKQSRKGGVLGTEGLMDVAKEASPETALGEVQKNTPQCAPGYVWDGTACVPANPDSEWEPPTKEEAKNLALDRLTGRALGAKGVFGPGAIGAALGGLEGYSDKWSMVGSLVDAGLSKDEALSVIENDPEKVAMMADRGMLDFNLRDPYNFAEANSVNSWKDVGRNFGRELANRVGGLFGSGNFGNETFGYQAVVPNLGISSLEGSMGMLSSGDDYAMRVADMERIRDTFDSDTGKYNFNPTRS